MIDNIELLKEQLAKGRIRMQDGEILHQSPLPLPDHFNFEKVEGMLLGLAVGDSLGATTEGRKPAQRFSIHGEITDYLSGSSYRANGGVTDDTQLSFWTLEQLIDDSGLIPDNLAKKFCKNRIYGIGGTTKEFLRNYKNRHVPWYEAGPDSLGNGALMRISPIVLPYLKSPHQSMYADAALDTMITHNAFANNATCVAFVKILWELLGMKTAPQPSWWVDTYCSIAKQLEGSAKYHPRNAQHADFYGPLWEFTHKVCNEALDKRLSTLEACNWWGSGASLFETVPSALYILALHSSSAEEAIIRAVNDTVDNDTIASIVGAAVGALYGLGGIPERWVKRLRGVIRTGGGYQVFRATLHAKQIFWLNA